MTRRATLWTAIAALAICPIPGCGSLAFTSHVEQHWGEAVQLNMGAMIANPEAGSAEPVEGLDPETAQHVADRYYSGQEEQRVQDIRSLLISE
jgi:type IV pilus biogenesis protein CpaD/CtpE